MNRRATHVRIVSLILRLAVLTVLAACAGAPAPRTHEVRVKDDGGTFRFEPANIEARAGDVVRFVYDGTLPHNVEFVRNSAPAGSELGEAWSGPYLTKNGDTYEVRIDESFRNGTYSFVCTPHVSMGMKGTLVVTGAAETIVAANAPAELPAIRGVKGLQPLAYEMDGDVKVFRLNAEKIRWETKEGTLIDAMAYNRMIPGPLIRVTEGDRVRIIVTNAMDEPHTTHWHGLYVPNRMDGVPGVTQDPRSSIWSGTGITERNRERERERWRGRDRARSRLAARPRPVFSLTLTQ